MGKMYLIGQKELKTNKETNDSLVCSPVVGNLEERVADCDVAFYRNCHHCVDRA